MIKEFCLAWENNKHDLEDYFRTHVMGEYNDYITLVKLLFGVVINTSLMGDYGIETDEITVVDDGCYQGTMIFILHKNTYQPGINDYVYTSVYYGSCSGCDTLQGIHQYEYDKFPDEDQINDYMSLCLHILQECNYF